MTYVFKTMLTNLIGMLVTKHMIVWGLKFAVSQTSNKIDDNAVDIVEGLYENNEEQVKKGVEGLTLSLKGEEGV